MILKDKEWVQSLQVGDIVCDCRYQHRKIVSFTVSGSEDKHLDLEGGFSCSAWHCCDPADHPRHWFVYIVRCKDNSLYTGITVDLQRRIKEHNQSKKGAKYTRSRRPVKLVRSFVRHSKSDALKLEHKIKKLSKKEKLQFND
jgi:putative endonuclease